LQVDHRYTSKRFVDSNNRGFFEGYSRVGLQAGLSNERFRAILYVENLFDDETVTTGGVSSDFRVTGFPNAAFGIQPDPRTYGIRLNYSL
jgi:outer membrane receptor protein involved in Fe transport